MRVRPQGRQEAGSLPSLLSGRFVSFFLWSACSVTIKNRPGAIERPKLKFLVALFVVVFLSCLFLVAVFFLL